MPQPLPKVKRAHIPGRETWMRPHAAVDKSVVPLKPSGWSIDPSGRAPARLNDALKQWCSDHAAERYAAP